MEPQLKLWHGWVITFHWKLVFVITCPCLDIRWTVLINRSLISITVCFYNWQAKVDDTECFDMRNWRQLLHGFGHKEGIICMYKTYMSQALNRLTFTLHSMKYAHCFVVPCFVVQHGYTIALQWRHNGHDRVSNHQPHDCLLNRLFRRRWKRTTKLRVTGLCAGNSPGTGEFPAQMASYAENVSIWWRHHWFLEIRLGSMIISLELGQSYGYSSATEVNLTNTDQ